MKQKGFSLIELMIVVAILAILVGVMTVSIYQQYTIKARVTEGLSMVSSAKLAVSESTAVMNRLPVDQASTGYTTPLPTRDVDSIVIGAQGVITITYSATIGGGTIVFTPTFQPGSDITWNCTGGTLRPSYRPAICRP